MNLRLFHVLFACGLIALAGGSHAVTLNAPQDRQISQQDPSAHDGIRAAINHYFQGQATGDASHMRMAFLPTARIESVREGKFTSLTLDEFCAFFKGKPASDEKSRVRTIDFIDASGNAGTARITLDHGATVITDYFLLLKVGDEWRIANKISFFGRKADSKKS